MNANIGYLVGKLVEFTYAGRERCGVVVTHGSGYITLRLTMKEDGTEFKTFRFERMEDSPIVIEPIEA